MVKDNIVYCDLCKKEIKEEIDHSIINIKNEKEKNDYCRICFNHMRKIHINNDNFYEIKNISYSGFNDKSINSIRELNIEYFIEAYEKYKKWDLCFRNLNKNK